MERRRTGLGVKYDVFLEREIHHDRERVPGNFRQRIRTAISSLATEPRPPISQMLDTIGIDVPVGLEMRRIRIDPWRLVYAIHEQEQWSGCSPCVGDLLMTTKTWWSF